MRTRYLIAIVIAGIILTVMSAISFFERPKIGDAAPPFELKDASGAAWSLESFRGRTVLLHFWATWCGTCLSELPALESAYRELGGGSVAIVTILTDDEGRSLSALKGRTPISFPVLLDMDGTVSDAYEVWGVPVSFLIDVNGVIVGRTSSPLTYNSLMSLLQIPLTRP